jgi:hypothetical protein
MRKKVHYLEYVSGKVMSFNATTEDGLVFSYSHRNQNIDGGISPQHVIGIWYYQSRGELSPQNANYSPYNGNEISYDTTTVFQGSFEDMDLRQIQNIFSSGIITDIDAWDYANLMGK